MFHIFASQSAANLTFLILSFLLFSVSADSKTFQLEFIDVEIDPYTRSPSLIILDCLIEEDLMAFPIQLSSLELSLMTGSSTYFRTSLSSYSENYFGEIGFKLGGPLPNIIADDDQAMSSFANGQLPKRQTNSFHLSKPFIFDIQYRDGSTTYTGRVTVSPDSLNNLRYAFYKKFGEVLRYRINAVEPGTDDR